MGQSKGWSLAEAATNTIIGYLLAVFANFYILRWLGYNIGVQEASIIGVIMTVVSIPRGYIVRRFYNWVQIKRE